MSAYDPYALWLMERTRLDRDLEHLRRIAERGIAPAGAIEDAHGPAAVKRPALSWRRRGIRPLLPGDA